MVKLIKTIYYNLWTRRRSFWRTGACWYFRHHRDTNTEIVVRRFHNNYNTQIMCIHECKHCGFTVYAAEEITLREQRMATNLQDLKNRITGRLEKNVHEAMRRSPWLELI